MREGSEYRPFQIRGSHHEASRLSGGAENLEGSILRPFTCIKKQLFFFHAFFIFSCMKFEKETSEIQKAQLTSWLGPSGFHKLP
jgi:hypothetical protein